MEEKLLEPVAHMRGIRLRRRKWQQPNLTWDHDHCAVCWARFAHFGGHEIQREGYTTCEDYIHGPDHTWVCAECVSKFSGKMGWWALEHAERSDA